MKKRGSSRRWIAEHENDKYVKIARERGLRSRAALKLEEIDQRDRLFKPGQVVVDLGAAPGGWSQIASKRVKPGGLVLATDILPMDPITDVTFVQGDFTEPEIEAALLEQVGSATVDLVLSDMAPNLSGIKAVDEARSALLAELAVDSAGKLLKRGGGLLIKLFQGAGTDDILRVIRAQYTRVTVRKPDASRARSREFYVLAAGFRL